MSRQKILVLYLHNSDLNSRVVAWSQYVGKVLLRDHHWYGNEDRLEIVNRIRFWRFLTGDAQFDVGYFLSRLENQPATGTASAFASVS